MAPRSRLQEIEHEASIKDKLGDNAQIYRQPQTPSASSSIYLSPSYSGTEDLLDASASTGKKRSRRDFATDMHSLLTTLDSPWIQDIHSGESSIARSSGVMSPAPFVNTRYRLAGGLDTPTGLVASQYDTDEIGSTYSEATFRRDCGSRKASQLYEAIGSYSQPLQQASGNTNSHGHKSSVFGSGWAGVVSNVVGGVAGVAGKLWDFCRANTFHGFYAGTGPGYAMPGLDESVWQDVDEQTNTTHMSTDYTNSTNIPGQYPEETYFPEFRPRMSVSPPPAKRIHTNNDGWVVVPSKKSAPLSRERSPSRVSTRKSPNSLTGNSAHRHILPATGPSASRAGARHMPNSRTSTSFAGSPTFVNGQKASYASPRSLRVSNGIVNSPLKSSPAAVEAQRYAAKRRREEKQQDESIRKLNAQLKLMIRQGKEALGSKVEIEDLDTDL